MLPASCAALALLLATPAAHADRLPSTVVVAFPSTPRWLAASNKVDLVDDEELLELVQMEVQELSVSTPVSGVQATLTTSDASYEIELSEVNATLHGAATLDALPEVDATLSVVAYDVDGVALTTLAGSLGADGSLSLVEVDRGDPGECSSRVGCEEEDEVTPVDLDLRGARLIPRADGAADLALDLWGADAWSVASVDLAVSVPVEGELVCLSYADDGSCLRGTTEVGEEITLYEVDLAAVASVWTGGLPVERGEVLEARAWLYGEEGARVRSVRSQLSPVAGSPEGMASTADLGTRAASTLVMDAGGDGLALSVVSDGWTLGAPLPTRAILDWAGGETWTVPVTSYQRAGARKVSFEGEPGAEKFELWVDGVAFDDAVAFADRGLCQDGTCVALTQDVDGGWHVSVTAWGTDAALLPDAVTVSLVGESGAAAPTEAAWEVELEAEIAASFSVRAAVDGDAYAWPLSLDVTLGAARGPRGAVRTLDRGGADLVLGVDLDGDLGLTSTDPDGGTVARGDILIGGEPIDIEREVGDEVVLDAPPAVLYLPFGGGRGTRTVATATTGKPGLL